jgi:putative transposase
MNKVARKKRSKQENKQTFGVVVQIYPNEEQEMKAMKTFGCRRFVYNLFLDQRSKAWKRRKESIYFKQQKDILPVLKKRIPFLSEIDSMALQETVKDLDDAFQNFFDGKVKYPRFKRKKDEQSYTTNQTNNNIRFTDHTFTCIQLPKLGKVRCEGSFVLLRRLLKNKGAVIKAATIRRKGGRYFVSLRIQKEGTSVKTAEAKRKAMGADFGIKTFAVLSDGKKIDNPRYFVEAQKQLHKQQKRLSRMKKGSSNYIKQKKKVAKIHTKVANQRKDFQHKWSKTLTDENQIICIEDLNVRGMIKNRKLAKHIADAAWYQFRTFLTYKALRKGRTLVVVDRFFASSKLCSSCNTKTGVLTLNERTWICPSCGKKHDRDENASLNIEKEGLRILGA